MELRTQKLLDLPFLLSQIVREQIAAKLTFQAKWCRTKCYKVGTHLQYFKHLVFSLSITVLVSITNVCKVHICFFATMSPKRLNQMTRNDTGLQTLNCGTVISKHLLVICPEESATFSATVTYGYFRDLQVSELIATPSFHLISTNCREEKYWKGY